MSHSGWVRLRPLGDPEELRGRDLDREVIKRAWRLARPYRGRLAAFVGLIVIGAALGALTPQIVRVIIDRAIPAGNTRLLTWLFVAMLAVAIAMALLSLYQRYLSASIGEEFILDLRTLLYEHVQAMPIAFFTRTQTGALITRLNNDVIGAQRALTGTLGGIVDNLIGVAVTLSAMFAMEWRVTLIAVALLPLFIVPARIVGRRLQALSREGMRLNADMNSTMTERFNVSGAMLVKLFGRASQESDLFRGRAERVADIGVASAMNGRVLYAALGFIGALATALVYLVGGRLAITETIEVGTVVALAMYVTQLYAPLAQLSNARVDLMTALVSFERVFEVTDLPHAIADSSDARPLPHPRGHVQLEDVWFRYPAAHGSTLESLEGPRSEHGDEESGWILRGIDLDAPPGTMVALVGPSGAGKTSIAMLVARLYDATAGSVRIDGHDVRDLTLAAVTGSVGVVTQDPHLFHDSIGNNLRYARPDATDEQLVAACKAARVHHVIERLPDGYETVVGERGYRLSGGEKQRIAIARMILKDPAIVVLDEATAHLDSESERLVQDALRDVLAGRTSIVIAHRLSTIVEADVILVVDDGRIVERGTHDELILADGLYADLARTQLTAAAG